MRMKAINWLIGGLPLAGTLFVATPSVAAGMEEGRVALRLWGTASPFLSGDAGKGEGAPEYTDLFDTGLGFGGEIAWRFSPRLSGLAGIGYETFSGGKYQGLEFSDLEIVPLYAGVKLHLIPESKPWDVYLRLDGGAAHFSSVDVSYGPLKGEYWDSSWGSLLAVGAGAEYRQGPWGVSLDLKARRMGPPDSSLGDSAKADASWTLPVSLGVNYHF